MASVAAFVLLLSFLFLSQTHPSFWCSFTSFFFLSFPALCLSALISSLMSCWKRNRLFWLEVLNWLFTKRFCNRADFQGFSIPVFQPMYLPKMWTQRTSKLVAFPFFNINYGIRLVAWISETSFIGSVLFAWLKGPENVCKMSMSFWRCDRWDSIDDLWVDVFQWNKPILLQRESPSLLGHHPEGGEHRLFQKVFWKSNCGAVDQLMTKLLYCITLFSDIIIYTLSRVWLDWNVRKLHKHTHRLASFSKLCN